MWTSDNNSFHNVMNVVWIKERKVERNQEVRDEDRCKEGYKKENIFWVRNDFIL
jgi:hypothetical protein